jgi:hypothetical protein
MEVPPFDVWLAHYRHAGPLALYLWAYSPDSGIQSPWLCTSNIRAAGYRNGPSFARRKYKIETGWYYQLFETDNSIHVFSAWTLKHPTVSIDLATTSITHADQMVSCTARTAGQIVPFHHAFQIGPQNDLGNWDDAY